MKIDALRVSVVMATYNGEKYVIQQLESVRNQTRKPDEVLIFDDQSTDSTASIIQIYINNNGLGENWRLVQNSTNLGFAENFMSGAEKASGDVIFFSDQDDIWQVNKIELMMGVFEKEPTAIEVQCFISNFSDGGSIIRNVFDKYGTESWVSWLKAKIFGPKIYQISFIDQVRKNVGTGMAIAVRKDSFLECAQIARRYHLTHDQLIGLFTAAVRGHFVMEVPLVYRRIHTANTSEPLLSLCSRMENYDNHIKGRYVRLNLMKACEDFSGRLSKDEVVLLKDAVRTMEKTIEALQERHVCPLIQVFFHKNDLISKKIQLFNIFTVLANKVM